MLFSDYLFYEPKEPRNPFTNLPLTYGQLYSIHHQLRAYGVFHWMLEAFAKKNYHLCDFVEMHETALKRLMIERAFNMDYTQLYMIEIMIDFIVEQHDNQFRDCDKCMYVWALKHASNNPFIKKWRELCYEHYVVYTTMFSDSHEYERKMDEIYIKATPLCTTVPKELYTLRTEARTSAKRPTLRQ